MQAHSATLHFPNVLARFAAPNLVRSTSSKQIRAHPRGAFFALYDEVSYKTRMHSNAPP